jgi:hypothetical protein
MAAARVICVIEPEVLDERTHRLLYDRGELAPRLRL